MMFATRRGLTDACACVSKQLESVYSSISATKRHLSSRIDRVDSKVDECADNTAATREEVSELLGDVKLIGADVQSVHHVVRSLETKISRIEGRQNETNFGVGKLIAFVRGIESSRTMETIEAAPSGSSRPALELPPLAPLSRTGSVPTNSLQEPQSPSSNGPYKELHGMSDESSSQSKPQLPNGVGASEVTHNEQPGGSGIFGRRFSGTSASFLTRSRSAMQSSK